MSAELHTDDPLPFTDQRLSRYGNFRVKIADSVTPGRYEIRAVGRHGVSNPRTFVVHSLAADLDAAPSTAKAKPTPLPVGAVYHAKTIAAQVQFFAIHVGQGQAVRIDCLAASIDSRAIPALTLFDASGRTVQTQRGSDSFDPRMLIDQAGDYVLGIHDAIYRGGEEFGYQVVIQPDQSAIDLASQASPEQIPSAWLPSAASGFAGLADGAIAVEETSDAKSITPPCKLQASFDSREDEDAYEFAANQGDQLVIDLISQRIGQPTDCRMILERSEPQASGDPQWQQVFHEDDSQAIGDATLNLRSTDPIAMFQAPATTTYRLTIRDLDSGQSLSRRQDYFVDLRRPAPGYELVAYRPYPSKDPNAARQFGSQLFRGGTESIRVFCLRRDGWTGAVDVTVEGLPAGVTCAPATIAANQNQTQLTLVATADAAPAVASLRVVGRATIAGTEQSQVAAPVAIQAGRGHLRESILSRRTTDIAIAVSGKDTLPVSIAIGDGKVAEIKKGESLTLAAKLTRLDGGKQNCVLRARDLPPKVSCGDLTINGDKSEGNLVLKVAADAPAGTYSLWWQTETKIKVKPNPQALERANAYRAHLKQLSEDPAKAEQRDAINAAIKTADARIEAAKGSAKDQDLTVYLPSPHVTIRIVEPK
jgi:hypothetical protein